MSLRTSGSASAVLVSQGAQQFLQAVEIEGFAEVLGRLGIETVLIDSLQEGRVEAAQAAGKRVVGFVGSSPFDIDDLRAAIRSGGMAIVVGQAMKATAQDLNQSRWLMVKTLAEALRAIQSVVGGA